jgi:hypothetical protein
VIASGPLADGRQSETAARIARGVRRHLRALAYSSVTELPLLDGRRADVVAVNAHSEIVIVEIKSSVADFRADHKWSDYRAHCDRLYFAIPDDLPAEIMPAEEGLIVADGFGAAVVREATLRRIAPATRRAVLLRFAQAAADRLHRLIDPSAAWDV